MKEWMYKELEMQTFLKINEGRNCENIIRRAAGLQCVSRQEFDAYNIYVNVWNYVGIVLTILFMVFSFIYLTKYSENCRNNKS